MGPPFRGAPRGGFSVARSCGYLEVAGDLWTPSLLTATRCAGKSFKLLAFLISEFLLEERLFFASFGVAMCDYALGPWPEQVKTTRQRSQSRGIKWADQSGAEEEAEAPSRNRTMAQTTWRPTEEAVARMRPLFYYLSHRMGPIPISEDSRWATDSNVEWPQVRTTRLTTQYAHEVRKILETYLKAFEEIPDGSPQWIFEAQDCFQGRVSWPVQWLAQTGSTHPNLGSWSSPLSMKCVKTLRTSGVARRGDVQHFGAYIVDTLYTIYSAQRGAIRTTALFGQCPN
eukprot:2577060-Amphidinium_carterae.2